jgi:hypothetical protein
MKQSRGTFAVRFAVGHLIPIGHVEVAMPSNIIYESVHCGYCWLTDQSEGFLIQVDSSTHFDGGWDNPIDQKERRSLSMTTCL